MGTVALIVADLNRSIAYYTDHIGLHVHRRDEGQAWLGAGGADLLQLTEQPGATPVRRGRTGLYHFALLLPNRRELARTLRHLVTAQTPLGGMSDHGVSEALYLSDPDGHGIEIYRDRPRDEWPVRDGELQMTLDPIDVPDLLREVTSGRVAWHGMDPATTMGHVHLHVNTLEAAEAFYCDLLGFELMQRFGGQASFVSAGGYHHHLGLNIWAGRGAPPPPADAARLDWYEIRLPDGDALDAVVTRLRDAGLAVAQIIGGVQVADPAGNRVRLVAEHSTSAATSDNGHA
jgi:catechol 2,3-dioxygenase